MGVSENQEGESACKEERKGSRLTNIKVPKELADTIRVYCIFNNKTVTDFTTRVLERELQGFRERLEKMKRLG